MELWNATFSDRETFRADELFTEYLQNFPVATAYNGELVSQNLSSNDHHGLRRKFGQK